MAKINFNKPVYLDSEQLTPYGVSHTKLYKDRDGVIYLIFEDGSGRRLKFGALHAEVAGLTFTNRVPIKRTYLNIYGEGINIAAQWRDHRSHPTPARKCIGYLVREDDNGKITTTFVPENNDNGHFGDVVDAWLQQFA